MFTRFPADRGKEAPDNRAIGSSKTIMGSRRNSRTQNASKTSKSSGRLPPMIIIITIAIFLPLSEYDIGGLALTPARIVLLIAIIPTVVRLISGAAGRIQLPDIMMISFVFWCVTSLLINGGRSSTNYAGITAVEYTAPYFIARTLIRSIDHYTGLVRLLFILSILCGIGAAIESLTTYRIYHAFFDIIGDVYPPTPERYEKRLGMTRSAGTFQHPILFGVALSLLFSPVIFLRRSNGSRGGVIYGALSFISPFFSLSTGAWLSVFTQLLLIAWAKVFTKKIWRWRLLAGLVVIGYIFIDAASNRSPFEVFVSYATLNASTSYMRILIFEQGIQNVWSNPIFGVGSNEWVRPSWMPPSVDNYWLLLAMRYGVPGFLLAAGGFLSALILTARANLTGQILTEQRSAYIFAFIGVALSACTVHLWGTAFYLVYLMLGAFSWAWEQKPSASSRNERL